MKLHVKVGGRELLVEPRGERDGKAVYLVDGKEVTLEVFGGSSTGAAAGAELRVRAGDLGIRIEPQPAAAGSRSVRFLADKRPVEAVVESERDRLRASTRPNRASQGRVTLLSTLPGIIRRILRRPGEAVEEGEPVLTLEAMKMENEVRAEIRGRVVAIRVREGQVVNAGEALAEIEAI